MDTYSFKNAGDLIIHYIEEICSDNMNFNGYEEKKEVYSTILKLNYKSQKFMDKFSFPKIDYSLINDNIISTANKYKSLNYFTPVEYQFDLLVFLFKNYEKFQNLDLRFIIDEFVNEISDKLSIKDIEITKTGAVRCKTNIRFAVMSLRQFGLVNYKNINSKRDWSPTLLGIFVCIQIFLNNPSLYENSEMETSHLFNSYQKVSSIDKRIGNIIKEFNVDSNFDLLIKKLDVSIVKLKHINKFKEFIKEYSLLIENYYNNVLPKLFTKKDLNLNIQNLLVREDVNIKNFKDELIDSTGGLITLEKANKILNNSK